MYTINYDAARNRLTVKVQEITQENVKQYISDFTKELGKVKSGFTGLTDLSGGKLFTQEVAQELAPLGELSMKKGLTKWAYYTGSAISKMQMKRMFGDIVESFEKMEEAEAYLKS